MNDALQRCATRLRCVLSVAFFAVFFGASPLRSDEAAWLGKSDFFNLFFGQDFATAGATDKEIVRAVAIVENCKETKYQLNEAALQRGEEIKDEFNRKTIRFYMWDVQKEMREIDRLRLDSHRNDKRAQPKPEACELAKKWSATRTWIEPFQDVSTQLRANVLQCAKVRECQSRAYSDGYFPLISPIRSMMCGGCKN